MWRWLLPVATLMACSPAARQDESVATILEEVRSRHAPDKRVVVWEVTFNQQVLAGQINLPAAKDELMQRLQAAGIDFVDSLEVLVPTFALVNNSVCNIRSEPRHAAELTTQALMGTVLRVYRSTGQWWLVQTPDDYLGWVDEGALYRCAEADCRQWLATPRVMVTELYGQLTDEQGQMVTDVLAGNILTVIDQQHLRYHLLLPDGRQGYLPTAVAVPFSDIAGGQPPTTAQLLETARRFMGIPYLWGGTSAKGVDCSGFTKMVFYLHGLQIPRDASQQVHAGMPVASDSTLRHLLPGDFLFFGREATASSTERITHVAIYLGDGKIIHASDRVKIESLRPGDPDFALERLATWVRSKRLWQEPGNWGVQPLAALRWY